MRITAWSSLKKGFDVFTANLPVMMMASVVILALQQVLDLLIPDEWLLLSALAGIVLAAPLYAGQYYIALQAVRGEPVSIRDLFVGVPQWGAILGAYVLSTLAASLGILLLIIPGIVVAVMFSFAAIRFVDPALGDRRVRSTQALRESREATIGVRWTLFEIGFLSMLPFILVITLSSIAAVRPGFPSWLLELVILLSGALFIGPVATASYMVVYDVATGSSGGGTEATEDGETDSGGYSGASDGSVEP